MTKQYTIGLDFGTDSVRALLIDASNGETTASYVHWYKRWKEKKYCNASINQFRQHPLDHIEGAEECIKSVLAEAKVKNNSVRGICIDTTGSSPLPVTSSGEALALQSGFEDNPNAMMVLWKDHTATSEAAVINKAAEAWQGPDYLKYVGGIYSSEWFWSKILHISKSDDKVKSATSFWMEHCDYMTFLLCGGSDFSGFKRSRCAAGHKALWHASWGGYPDLQFFENIDPYLADVRKNLPEKTFTSNRAAGHLNIIWAKRLGLTQECVVSVGTFDAHAGAIGAEVKENTLIRVMGTSTCDILIASQQTIGNKAVKGICGQVDGSVIPGMVGLEAGQSAFGDMLAWFIEMVLWPISNLSEMKTFLTQHELEHVKERLIVELSNEAASLPLVSNPPLALDWINGRRTPDANQELKGAIANLSLGDSAPQIFRALIESICYGARAITDRFDQEGVKIDEVVGIGGVAKKSDLIMQTLANVLNMPIKIAVAEQAPALGATMYAAVAAGIYNTVEEAILHMGSGFEKVYTPEADRVLYYNEQYKKYQALGQFVQQEI